MNTVPYILYDASTGEIKKTGTCPKSLLLKQLRPGLSIMEGHARATKNRVVNGQVVAKGDDAE
jgi:hypothetical protein